uniref:legumain-like isoform X1 n=2 Tax=Ciona intestinalis TaxID=7719 RepID=UPI000052361E|nr:legumain-like isoform X1 [Ciona intestinalis]|eukprot:XP_002130826.1 legumain-like isoform X1 [Ciona intestinalis]
MKLLYIVGLIVIADFAASSPSDFAQQFNKVYQPVDEPAFKGKIWAVLVAGSSGYYNYRHQADVCHAYQVVHSHGIPDEQIIVMMYDDIANNEQNPTQGIIINHPDGPDVYKCVLKDYTGKDVTPSNFLKVLTGDKEGLHGIGSGRALESGPHDHVFVYFADHGAPGLIAFPTGELMKKDLNNAINTMYNKKFFAQLVFYLEACESGSMFEKTLSDSMNVYATTAANSEESSYACYFDEKRGTYLGDRYSVSWLEDSDQENLDQETLHKQFKVAKKHTNQSHVMQYGNLSMSHEVVGIFQGERQSKVKPMKLRPIYDDVPSPDVPIHILKRKIAAAKNPESRQHLQLLLAKEFETRRRIEWTTRTIANVASNENDENSLVTSTMPALINLECYTEAVKAFDSMCYELDDYEYGYRQLFVFGNLCDNGIPTSKVVDSIRQTCS